MNENGFESIENEIARVVALNGLGTVNGRDRFTPPNDEWDRKEWHARILEVIPQVAELQCREAARYIVKAILGRSNKREIDDGIRSAPKFAAEQIRKFNPGLRGLTFNLDRLSDVLDTFAVREVVAASCDRSGEAGETALAGSTEGESAVPCEDTADAQKDLGNSTGYGNGSVRR